MNISDCLKIESAQLEYYPETDITNMVSDIKTISGLESMLCMYLYKAFIGKVLTPRRARKIIKIAAKNARSEKEYG